MFGLEVLGIKKTWFKAGLLKIGLKVFSCFHCGESQFLACRNYLNSMRNKLLTILLSIGQRFKVLTLALNNEWRDAFDKRLRGITGEE